MSADVPFTPEEIKKINEIMALPAEQQQKEWQEFSKALSEEQIQFLMKKQQGSGGGGCLFCKIAGGEVAGRKIYEDGFFMGVLDIKPANKGHVIVFPKKHYKNLIEMNDEFVGGMFMVVSRIGKKMVEVTKCDGWNIFVANGVVAGQGIDHVLVHIIPRFKDDVKDGGVSFGWKGKEVSEEELNNLVEKMKVGAVSGDIKKEDSKNDKNNKNDGDGGGDLSDYEEPERAG